MPPQPPDRYTARVLKDLVENVHEHNLVLFVGAGINGKALPLWGRLLNQLLDQAIQGTFLEDSRVPPLAPHLLEWASSALGYVTPKDRLEGRHLEIYQARDRKLEAAREQRRQRRANPEFSL